MKHIYTLVFATLPVQSDSGTGMNVWLKQQNKKWKNSVYKAIQADF